MRGNDKANQVRRASCFSHREARDTQSVDCNRKPHEKGREMREILFRGKRIYNGEWIYGYLAGFVNNGKVACISSPEHGVGHGCHVDPETVGQFTGLQDKNGKDIFEGDIVLCCSWIDWEKNKSRPWSKPDVVIFNIEDSRFSLSKSIWNFGGRGYEIIGNIHNNPELLED